MHSHQEAIDYTQARRLFRRRLRLMTMVCLCSIVIPSALSFFRFQRTFVLISDSMAPTLHVGDILIVKPVGGEIAEGSIVVFKSPFGDFQVHRIIDQVMGKDGVHYITQGDANVNADSFLLPQENVVGTLFFVIPRVGIYFLIPRELALVATLALILVYVVLVFKFKFPNSVPPQAQSLPPTHNKSRDLKNGETIKKHVGGALLILAILTSSILNAQSSVNLIYPVNSKTASVTTPSIVLQEGNAGTSLITDDINADVSVELSLITVDDYVDNNGSDIDSSSDMGIHSNFTAQQYGPDATYDLLTEEDVSTGYEEYLWVIGNDDFVRKLNKTDLGGSEILSWDTGVSYPFSGEHRMEDGNEYIYVVNYQGKPADKDHLIKFHAENGTEVTRWNIGGYSDNAYGLVWNGSRWFIADGGAGDLIYQVDPADPTTAERSFFYSGISDPHGLAWDGVSLWVVDSATKYVYQIDIYGNIQASWSFPYTDPVGIAYDTTSGHLWITDATSFYLYEYYANGTEIDSWDPSGTMPQGISYAMIGGLPNHQLDLEVQFTDVDFDESAEELCIYGGAMDAENLTVDVWNSTAWASLFTDIEGGWNNASIASYLSSATLTIRFKGGTETDDSIQDSWNIDAVLLHLYTSSGEYDYVLQVNNTDPESYQIRLKQYADANINRLQNCTIYFHDVIDGTSVQIYVDSGDYSQAVGPWYTLPAASIIYIALTATTNSTEVSTISTYLEIQIPDSGIKLLYPIVFEID